MILINTCDMHACILMMISILQASITWKECANLPTELSFTKPAVINGEVYCGGEANDDDNDYIVFYYDPSQDKWTTLPPLPVRFFGLGQVNGTLVAVGGMKKSRFTENRSNDVYTYDN
jgi:hypothetical protein